MIKLITYFPFAFILLSLKLNSQSNVPGIYYYSGPCIHHEINLFSDNKGYRKIVSRGETHMKKGIWKTNGDTICLIIESFSKNCMDTCYYVILDSLRIKQYFSENEFNTYYNKKTEYHSNGNIKYEIKDYNSEPVSGIVNYYHENGKLKLISKFKRGKIHGEYYEFNEKGILIEEGKYRKGLKRKITKHY